MRQAVAIGTLRFTLFISIALAAVYNLPLWREVWRLVAPLTAWNALFLVSFFVLVVALLNMVLSVFAFKYVLKPVVSVILLATAGIGYFMSSYGVMIDDTMIQNIMETDASEALDLINLRLVWHLIVFGALPVLLIWRMPVVYRAWPRELKAKAVSVVLSITVVVVTGLAFYQDYVSLFRNHPELRYLFAPANFVAASAKHYQRARDRNLVVKAIGTDAVRGAHAGAKDKNSLFVLVVGETARAQNFSLGGYPRPTNLYVSREDIAYFSNVYACGTATAVSLPCMFSNLGHDRYNGDEARRREGLLDVLSHAGLRVLWRDNNSGCKGACARVETQPLSAFQTPEWCEGDRCFDEVLLNGLDQYLDGTQGDTVIVLHQNGSHGPAYYRRYPKRFERFKPVCASNELQKCSQEEIRNTYDNTILYTDYFLSRVIQFLKARSDRYDTAMIYLSDHGESLGEHNLYLHGLPYFIAPEEQKRVPLMVWMSDDFGRDFGIDRACLREHARDSLSHDNLFHSVLGMLDVKTGVYDPGLDIFRACRAPTMTAKAGASAGGHPRERPPM